MDNYRWIKARFLGNDEEVSVRQQEEDRSLFIDKDGLKIPVTSLDFTLIQDEQPFMTDFNERMRKQDEERERTQNQLREMLAAMDTRAIADHQAEIDERKYWMKLRGDIFMSILENGGVFTSEKELDWAANQTERMFNAIYEQHRKFTNKG